MQVEDPPKSLNQKDKTQWSISWVGLPQIDVSTKPIVPQIFIIIPNNRVMFMEHIFQISINKCKKYLYPKVRSIIEDHTRLKNICGKN